MELRQISKWTVITGTLLIWLIKFGIRPFFDFDEGLQFFFGIAPNFFGSFLIPFGACWFFSQKEFLIARIFHIRSIHDLRMLCFLGFGMLLFNEYLQLMPVFGRTFDFFDIIFSGLGIYASYFVFGRLYVRYEVSSDI